MMKKVIALLLILMNIYWPGAVSAATEEPLEGTITMSGAWALYPMAVKWAEEFQKLHPKVKIDIAAGGAGKGMADALAAVVDIGNVSREIYPEEIAQGAWFIAVTKDAVVPTFNADNPLKAAILAQGIVKDDLAQIWIAGGLTDWKNVVQVTTPISEKTELHIYTRSDACGAAQTWAEYLGGKQEDLLGIGVYGDPGVAEAVRKDDLGIGFNNINYVYDAATKKPIEGILVLPFDLNGNGTIEADENFYNDRDAITAAIAAGKYPSPPARALYFVSQGKPQRKVVLEFIKWVLTEGQQYIPEAGYINLTPEKIQEGLQKLAG
jgi:phosphate transport system substrate-binding protein